MMGLGSPGPIFKEYWPFNQSWLDYVNREWIEGGRVQLDSRDIPERLEFMHTAEEAYRRRDISFRYMKTYMSKQLPEKGTGYTKNYPHTHEPKYATTLIHYLQPGDKPAPLDIFDGDEVIETIYPEIGLTVYVPNNIKHGVRINQGQLPRIQLIATGIL